MNNRLMLFLLLLCIGLSFTLCSCGSSSSENNLENSDTVSINPLPAPPRDNEISDFSGTSFAFGTPVFMDNSLVKNIQYFMVGDPIYCANSNLQWEEGVVTFSAGTSPLSPPSVMIYLSLSAGADVQKELVVTRSSLIFMADHQLKEVGYLVPGDRVLGANGTLFTVDGIAVGRYSGGVHGVMVKKSTFLINVNGIIFAHYGYIPPQ